jgi:hypothetical protein
VLDVPFAKPKPIGWKASAASILAKLDRLPEQDERAVALFRGLKELDQQAIQRVYAAVAALKLKILEEIDRPTTGRGSSSVLGSA